MASSAQLRLMSDLRTIINEPPEGCSASPLSDDNLMVWSATIFGPDETPWEVYRDGSLCMDIIQDAWSPCHNVSTILIHFSLIQTLQVQQTLMLLTCISMIYKLTTRGYAVVLVIPLSLCSSTLTLLFVSTFLTLLGKALFLLYAYPQFVYLALIVECNHIYTI
ncbi:ubiquitin-conjugating enzyme E2-16 kDa isoform X2 [Pyrus x bretschneideri]|uniref:ubiquitin-conjugating enzyme E2-16 kDa isoform X2 n=1 Tax=Pyrus x bretschneideri TaxID=225117 RepID=UPI00202ED68C|nr:ubiquitin-conjugating enzyme E2-16 kDa isoform X2 [Pyrus x bretschneideri]